MFRYHNTYEQNPTPQDWNMDGLMGKIGWLSARVN